MIISDDLTPLTRKQIKLGLTLNNTQFTKIQKSVAMAFLDGYTVIDFCQLIKSNFAVEIHAVVEVEGSIAEIKFLVTVLGELMIIEYNA